MTDDATAGSPELEAAWKAVLESWDDEETHGRFIALADTYGELGEAGRRYRAIREQDPERRAVAARQTDRLLGVAVARLKPLRATSVKNLRARIEIAAVVVAGILVLTVCWLAFLR